VLATNCEGKDTSAVEFSFLCADATGMEVKHTFGTGGFLDKETYDTEVACEKCLRDGTEATTAKSSEEAKAPAKEAAPAEASAPAEAEAPAKANGSDSVVSTADSRALLTKFAKSKTEEPSGVPPATASFYGPGGCVAVYSKDGSCWMQTRCQGQNITEYDFGMNCADSDGQITKHMFGKNSFDPEETFNTLVSCDTCLALDQEPAKGVTDLAITVLSLEKELDGIKADVKGIRDAMNSTEEEDSAPPEETSTGGETTTDDGETSTRTTDDGETSSGTDDQPAATLVDAESDAESAESQEAAEAAATAAEDAATEDAEDDDDAKMFLKKSHKTMRKVRHHAQHHHDRPVRKVHHRAHATMKKHVHHKRVVDEDLDLDQPDMAEY
jgi:hypothetical protein